MQEPEQTENSDHEKQQKEEADRLLRGLRAWGVNGPEVRTNEGNVTS